MNAVRTMRASGELKPVQARGRWITWGLALQVIGVGIPVTAALNRAGKDGVLGSITGYTIRLVARQMLHSPGDLALTVLGIAVFVAGSIVLARPFVRRRSSLLVGVPLAAVCGVVVFGVFAVVVAALIAAANGDWSHLLEGISWPGPGRRRRK